MKYISFATHRKQRRVSTFAALLLTVVAAGHSKAQAPPTAVKKVPISFFGGASGVYTGLLGGKNLNITAGTDVRFRDVLSLEPSLEFRGTYPLNHGNVDSQKNILGGVRMAHTFGRLTPYGDILFGLGQIHYRPLRANPTNTFAYSYSSSTVLSPGAGVDFDINPSWGIKFDGQFQRYSTPVTESKRMYAKSFTVGVVYRLFSGKGPR